MLMNPIFASSARRRMRSWKVPLVIVLFGVVMLFITYFAGLNPLMGESMTINRARSGLDAHIYLTAIEFLLIVIVAPAMTAGSISGERERQTLEMLLVTNTGSLRIVLGKLLESLSYQVLLIVAMLPFNCAIFVYGGVGMESVLQSALFLIVTAFAASSVGLLCSALFKRSVTATVISYIAVLAIGIGTLLLLALTDREALSDTDVIMSMSTAQLLGMIPAPVFINPILGLLMLLADQSGVLENTIQNWLPNGYWMFTVYEKLTFGLMANAVMVGMTAAGALLTVISAFFVRPRVRVRRRK